MSIDRKPEGDRESSVDRGGIERLPEGDRERPPTMKRPWAIWAGGWWGWEIVAGAARYGSEQAAEAAARRRYPDCRTRLGYAIGVGRTDGDGGKPRKLARQ